MEVQDGEAETTRKIWFEEIRNQLIEKYSINF